MENYWQRQDKPPYALVARTQQGLHQLTFCLREKVPIRLSAPAVLIPTVEILKL